MSDVPQSWRFPKWWPQSSNGYPIAGFELQVYVIPSWRESRLGIVDGVLAIGPLRLQGRWVGFVGRREDIPPI